MGFFAWLRRCWTRRTYLKQEECEAAGRLGETPLAEAAPAVAQALAALQAEVRKTAYDAVSKAHDSLAPICRQAVSEARSDLEAVRECQAGLADQLKSLRQLYGEQQEQSRRWAESYDWQLIKEFCFRFIRILDSLEDSRIKEPGGDLEDCYQEIQFALEASGVEQFRPDPGSAFAGNEKRLKVVGKVSATNKEGQGLVASVRRPGYLLAREGQPDRILRPAWVEVFEAHTPTEQPQQLQEIES